MPKGEQTVVEDFLGNLKDTNQEPFDQKAEDPFAGTDNGEQTGEKKEGAQDQGGEEDNKPVPFHKDPKLQRFIQKEIAKGLSQNKPTATETFVRESATTTDEADELLTRIIGNDTPEKRQAVSDFKKYLSSLEDKGAQKAIAKLQEESQREKAEEAQAQEELVSGFENIEDQFGVDLSSTTAASRKLRSDFIDFIRRVSPKDGEGNVVSFPDLTETFTVFQDVSKKPQNNSRAKDLASRSMDRSSTTSAPVSTDNSWKAVDKILSKLN